MNLWGEVLILIQKIRKMLNWALVLELRSKKIWLGETVSKNCNNRYAILFIADLMFKLSFELDTFIFI
jgi:hypothetical protein